MANWKGTAVPNNEMINSLYLNTNLTNEEMIALIDSVEMVNAEVGGVNAEAYSLINNSTFGASLIVSRWVEAGSYAIELMFANGSQVTVWNNINGWNQEGITFFEQGIGANLPIMNELDKSEYFNYYQNDKLSSLLSITPFTKSYVIGYIKQNSQIVSQEEVEIEFSIAESGTEGTFILTQITPFTDWHKVKNARIMLKGTSEMETPSDVVAGLPNVMRRTEQSTNNTNLFGFCGMFVDSGTPSYATFVYTSEAGFIYQATGSLLEITGTYFLLGVRTCTLIVTI